MIRPHYKQYAFTIVELMVSLTCGLMILAAVITAGVALQRSLMAVEGYSMAEGDQLRVQDYIAMDCRRAMNVVVDKGSWTNVNGTSTWTTNSNDPTTLIISVPNYYDGNGNPVAPDNIAYGNSGAIQYGSATTRTIATANGTFSMPGQLISYYRSGSDFIRRVNGVEKAIATNVASFTVAPQDLTSSVTCSVTFTPRFTSLPNPGPINGTTVFSNTFLRNAVARQ
jgi:Tfp pilus assembly protein PilW